MADYSFCVLVRNSSNGEKFLYFRLVSYSIRIREALDNAEEWIAYLAQFNDRKLERRLDIIHQQIDIALANGQLEAVALLRIWREQTIEARLMKYDQHPPLDKMTELEEIRAEREAMEREIEKREKTLAAVLKDAEPKPIAQEEQIEQPTVEIIQMKLF